MGKAQGEEFVATVALQAVATVTLRAGSKAELQQAIQRAFCTESGEWELSRFQVREANVQVVAFGEAFKLRTKHKPTMVERRAVNDSLQMAVVGPIVASLVS